MHALFREEPDVKRDAIAANQLHALRKYQSPREKKLRLDGVVELFLRMKDSSGGT